MRRHDEPTDAPIGSGRSPRRAAALAAVLACALVALAAAADDGRPGLRFVSPRSHARAVGIVPVELAVTLPPGVRAERLVISVDGKPSAALTAPPWKTVWDAGDGLSPHRLEAALHLSDGSVLSARLETAALKVDHVEEVSLVNVYAVVRNRDGEYVDDLQKGDFRIFEDGRPQVVDRFATERKPLRVAIVLDTSLTMKGAKIDAAREAALEFLEILEPGDEGLVVAFNDDVRTVQELTGDRNAMASAIRSLEAVGGTALYDAVYRTADLLERFDGRRVLVLLSDGRDEAASGLEPGSLHTADEALDGVLRNEVMVFAIGFGSFLDEELDFYGRESLASVLTRFAETTGGAVRFQARASRIRKTFREVAQDLRHQYSLAYVSDNRKLDGSWREIRVAVSRPDLRPIARSGYFARSSSGPRGEPRRRRPERRAGAAAGPGS